jgi:dephospho-CoA kinase
MLRIGLTGGIGSGKSTVAQFFEQLGVEIIDTDLIAREIVEPGTKALSEIVAHFGKETLNPDHSLNRKILAQKIFHHPQEKQWLETLLHPLIAKKVEIAVSKVKSPYCIIVIPLLIETFFKHLVDRILVINSTQSLQISRTSTRDQRPESEITAIISSQATPEQRRAAADDLINNDGTLSELQEAVAALHQQYLKMDGVAFSKGNPSSL